MSTKLFASGTFGLLTLALVMIGIVRASDDGFPGRAADPELVASIRASATGPCNNEGTVECTCNVGSETCVTVVERGVRGCKTIQDPQGNKIAPGCGSGCTGPRHTTCKSQNENPCTENSDQKCCTNNRQCVYDGTDCICRAQQGAPDCGVLITCVEQQQ